MASPAKLAVAETASSVGSLASVTASNSGYSFPGATKYVSGITVSNDGNGVVTAVSIVPNANGNIVLTPTPVAGGSGQLTWACTTTIDKKYVPAECRG
ncbi:MAG: pilin [Ottowia sp.]|nr:pilin [Ottowia sp.]